MWISSHTIPPPPQCTHIHTHEFTRPPSTHTHTYLSLPPIHTLTQHAIRNPQVFVARNIANLVVNTDMSLLAVLEYAVHVLEVRKQKRHTRNQIRLKIKIKCSECHLKCVVCVVIMSYTTHSIL